MTGARIIVGIVQRGGEPAVRPRADWIQIAPAAQFLQPRLDDPFRHYSRARRTAGTREHVIAAQNKLGVAAVFNESANSSGTPTDCASPPHGSRDRSANIRRLA